MAPGLGRSTGAERRPTGRFGRCVGGLRLDVHPDLRAESAPVRRRHREGIRPASRSARIVLFFFCGRRGRKKAVAARCGGPNFAKVALMCGGLNFAFCQGMLELLGLNSCLPTSGFSVLNRTLLAGEQKAAESTGEHQHGYLLEAF